MGYQQENYIIENDVEDWTEDQNQQQPQRQPVRISQNTRYAESEAIEPVNVNERVLEEIEETAKAEGLYIEDDTPFGGEGNPSPEAVITDFINQKRPEAVEQKIVQYEEEKVEKTKKVMATRELLTGMTKRLISVTVPVAVEVRHADGSIVPEVRDLEFKVRRLTESQVNHLYNRRMIGKTVQEMTKEELDEDNHFRSNFLAEVITEPKMTFTNWYEETPAVVTGAVFNAVQDALSKIDDTSLFQ